MLSRKLFAVPSRIWTASIGRVGVGVTAGKLNQVKLGFLNGRIITGCWLVDYLKPRNCAWSMEARMSLSTGVSWGFSMVKAESKYWTSRIWRCTAQERKTTPSINRYSESFVVRFICLKINQSIIHDIVSYFKTQCGKIAVEDWRYLRLWVWRAVQYLCVRVAPSWCSWRRDGRRFRQRCNPAFPAASEDLSPTTENRRKGIISGTRAFLSHNILAERKKMGNGNEEWQLPGREWPLSLWRGSAGNKPVRYRYTRRVHLHRSRWMATVLPPFRRGGRRKTTNPHIGYTSNLW